MARGFTTIEILVTIGILGSIFAVSAYGLSRLQQSFAAQNVDRELTSLLTTAARRARHGAQGTAWGVYIPYDPVTRTAATIALFSGTSYAARNTAYDQIVAVNDDVQFTYVDFSGVAANTGNDTEIVFTPLTGATTQYGSVTMTWYKQSRTITLDADGIPVR